MIPLMKNAFLREAETKAALAEFIRAADKLSMGEQCRRFEEAFATYQGRRHAVLVNSGSSANLLMLQSLKSLGRLKPGDKVGFSALTWSTNVMPIIQMDFDPVPIDCEVTTLNVSPKTLRERLDKETLGAFFITNALGFAGDLSEIRRICAERSIILIEDNCESLGTELLEGKTGNFGVAASFSFFVAHHMSTIEGGMLVTDDQDLATMFRMGRANGWDRKRSICGRRKSPDFSDCISSPCWRTIFPHASGIFARSRRWSAITRGSFRSNTSTSSRSRRSPCRSSAGLRISSASTRWPLREPVSKSVR